MGKLKPRYYKRDGTPYHGKDDVLEWARDFEKVNRIVKRDRLFNGMVVSTVWLGIDYNFSPKGKPLIFETMVFSNEGLQVDERDMDRYSTEDKAVKGHEEMVKKWNIWKK